MKYYKDSINNIYAYESNGSQDDYIKSDLVPITDEEAEQIRLASIPQPTLADLAEQAKQAKDEALNSITVTTTSGKVFDGNEVSITRMLAAIASSEFLGVTAATWKLADNTMVLVTLNEVKEALALAIQRVGEIVTA